MIKIINGKLDELDKKIVDSMLRLRYDVYLNSGFIKPNKSKKILDDYDKKAYHFIALYKNQVVGSLSVIENNLPLESIFKKEKNELVKKYKAKKVFELTKFVIKKDFRIKDSSNSKNYENLVSLNLFKSIYRFLIFKRFNLVLITVHPKYKKRYTKYYNFKQYGSKKDYSTFNNNPAILMYQTRYQFFLVLIKKLKNLIFFIK